MSPRILNELNMQSIFPKRLRGYISFVIKSFCLYTIGLSILASRSNEINIAIHNCVSACNGVLNLDRKAPWVPSLLIAIACIIVDVTRSFVLPLIIRFESIKLVKFIVIKSIFRLINVPFNHII